MQDKISIANTASVLLGGSEIQSFDDSGTESIAAKLMYDMVYEQLLAYRGWTFAKGRRVLQRMDKVSELGYSHVYFIPSDIIRVIGIQGTSSQFEIVAKRELHTDSSECCINGLIKPREEDLPSDFVMALVHILAANMAPIITDNDSQRDRFESLGAKYLNIAADNDAVQQPMKYSTYSPLLRYHR